MPASIVRFREHGMDIDTFSAVGGFAISPDNNNELTYVTRMLLATGAGNIAVTMVDGTTLTIPFAANQALPLAVKKVSSSGTTATGILGFY